MRNSVKVARHIANSIESYLLSEVICNKALVFTVGYLVAIYVVSLYNVNTVIVEYYVKSLLVTPRAVVSVADASFHFVRTDKRHSVFRHISYILLLLLGESGGAIFFRCRKSC